MKQQIHYLEPIYSQQQIQAFSKQLADNKRIMFQILENSLKIGVYKNQTKKDWEHFYQYFINFLKSQIGPRGECSQSIRKELTSNAQQVNHLLTPFKLRAESHIRQIYMKIQRFVPCPEYLQLKKIEQARQKIQINIQRFQDENSPMVKNITEGLIKKNGIQHDVKPQLAILKQNYVVKLKQADQYLKQLRQIVQKCESYHQLRAVQQYFEPYFQQWKQADSEIGKQSVKTGSKFQEKVFQTFLPYLYYLEQTDKHWPFSSEKLQVFTNLSWLPKSLGQIDIALGYKDEKQNRYFITTLIQCKSRLFDLREAHRQVSLQDDDGINRGPTFQQLKAIKKIKMLKQQNASKKQKDTQNVEQQIKKEDHKQEQKVFIQGKKFLSTKYGPAELVKNHHFYIITTLPPNPFVLPIESKLKEGIQKFTRNMFVDDIQSQPLYLSLYQKFQNVLSPLEWLKDYESNWKGPVSNIIVLK